MKQGRYEDGTLRCECGRVVAVDVVPSREGGRVPCKSCNEWVMLPLPPARPPRLQKYPLGGG